MLDLSFFLPVDPDGSTLPVWQASSAAHHYHLFGILEHQGASATSGHYTAIIRDLREKAGAQVATPSCRRPWNSCASFGSVAGPPVSAFQADIGTPVCVGSTGNEDLLRYSRRSLRSTSSANPTRCPSRRGQAHRNEDSPASRSDRCRGRDRCRQSARCSVPSPGEEPTSVVTVTPLPRGRHGNLPYTHRSTEQDAVLVDSSGDERGSDAVAPRSRRCVSSPGSTFLAASSRVKAKITRPNDATRKEHSAAAESVGGCAPRARKRGTGTLVSLDDDREEEPRQDVPKPCGLQPHHDRGESEQTEAANEGTRLSLSTHMRPGPDVETLRRNLTAPGDSGRTLAHRLQCWVDGEDVTEDQGTTPTSGQADHCQQELTLCGALTQRLMSGTDDVRLLAGTQGVSSAVRGFSGEAGEPTVRRQNRSSASLPANGQQVKQEHESEEKVTGTARPSSPSGSPDKNKLCGHADPQLVCEPPSSKCGCHGVELVTRQRSSSRAATHGLHPGFTASFSEPVLASDDCPCADGGPYGVTAGGSRARYSPRHRGKAGACSAVSSGCLSKRSMVLRSPGAQVVPPRHAERKTDGDDELSGRVADVEYGGKVECELSTPARRVPGDSPTHAKNRSVQQFRCPFVGLGGTETPATPAASWRSYESGGVARAGDDAGVSPGQTEAREGKNHSPKKDKGRDGTPVQQRQRKRTSRSTTSCRGQPGAPTWEELQEADDSRAREHAEAEGNHAALTAQNSTVQPWHRSAGFRSRDDQAVERPSTGEKQGLGTGDTEALISSTLAIDEELELDAEGVPVAPRPPDIVRGCPTVERRPTPAPETEAKDPV